MKKPKLALNDFKVQSFTTSDKQEFKGGRSNNRVCATYTSPENCDSIHPLFCETGFRCP